MLPTITITCALTCAITVAVLRFRNRTGTINEDGYLSFYYKNQLYYVPVITHVGPIKFISVFSGDEDVTSLILPYSGPKRDFYGREVTPLDFGYEELTFDTFRGRLTFRMREAIIL